MPSTPQDYPGGRAIICQAFVNRGVQEEIVPVLLNSLANSTLKQYETAYKAWWKFCQEWGYSVFEGNTQQLLQFLNDQLNTKQLKFGSINNLRSALSLILNYDITINPSVKRFMKGIFRMHPPKRKYDFIWDTNIVLDYLEQRVPTHKISLMGLAKKTATLLALVTGHRIQTLARIRVDQMIISPEGVQIFISDHLKTTNKNNANPCLQIPYFPERPGICPATYLESYVNRTAAIRSEVQDYLFLTSRPPYQTASTSTISRWIKCTLADAGIDTSVFSAYSVRHAASSAAYKNGVTLETIRRTAGWTESSKMFAKHYHLPSRNLKDFAKCILSDKA